MTPVGAPGPSLRRRLLWAAAAWITLALAAVAWVLVLLFQQHVERELAQHMHERLDELTAALRAVPAPDAGPAPRLQLEREPADPRSRQPYGGSYWLVRGADGQLLRSRSLWDHLPALPWAEAPADAPRRVQRSGPREQTVAYWMRRIELPGSAGPVVLAAGEDITPLRRLTVSYARTLVGSLAVVALALMAAAWLQVRLGLAPLDRLRAELARVRSGRSALLDGRHPAELQPLVDDLNGLLADNAALVEDARRQSGNLAHALKTPLAVLDNAAAGWQGEEGTLWREQLAAMRRQVDLHLARARAAAGLRTRAGGGPATALAPLLEGLLRALERLHAGRDLRLRIGVLPPGARLRADAHELQEMLGNLLDNACQWAAGTVEVSASELPEGRLALRVDDDGPGIPAELRAEVLQRGRRLDERRPGHGLGLAIADELARLHGGSLRLADAPLGGLRAELVLPRADAAPD